MSKTSEKKYGACQNPECMNYGISDVIPNDGNCPMCHLPMKPEEESNSDDFLDTSDLDEETLVTPPTKGGGINGKLIGIILGAILLLGGIGYGVYALVNNLSGDSKPITIKLAKSEITMNVGETTMITPIVEPEGVKATFIYKVSKDSKIVSVSDKGMITALDSGETKVLVKCIENPALKAVCKIRVNAMVSLAKDSTETSKETSKEESKEEPKAEQKKTEPKAVSVPSRDNSYGTSNLGYGVYEGPKENGKPSGMGGQIRFTRSYTIDLKKASGETVDVNPGDVMINVKMKDGRLIQGQLKRTDGSQRWIIIG